jgi:hypothetical protein
MIRYIKIANHETRCRSDALSGSRHNDCGRLHECARALAATGGGAPVKDLSRGARSYPGVAMHCEHYLSIADAEASAAAGKVRPWVGGSA